MTFHDHSKLAGQHAILSASRYHWINYDEAELRRSLNSLYATVVGTTLHSFAEKFIRHSIKLQKSDKRIMKLYLLDNKIPACVVDDLDLDSIFANIMAYVNDGVGFKMEPEVILYYSDNCFGTADSIIFRDGLLRIHDLKTGTTPAHMEQLMIYAALFCLEYKQRPGEIDMDLRIYQGNDIIGYIPEVDEIAHIMDKIITFDKYIAARKEK